MDRKDKIEQNKYKWISRKDKMDIIDNYLVIAKKNLKLMGSGKRKEWKLSLSPKPFTHTTLVSTIQNSQPSHTFDKENTNKQKFLKGCLILQAWIFHTKT